jgi:hypothetical protein
MREQYHHNPYFSKLNKGDNVQILPSRKLVEMIAKYGDWGVISSIQYASYKFSIYSINRNYLESHYNSYAIMSEKGGWLFPEWFFEIGSGQLEFDFGE